MFTTSLKGGKPFAANQKIRELKTRIVKLKGQKLKLTPKKIIEISTANMNIKPSRKYSNSPEKAENNALNSKRFRTLFNMYRTERTNKTNARIDRFDRKQYLR